MMDLETMRRMETEMMEEAIRLKKKLFVPTSEEVEKWRKEGIGFPAPNFGSYRPKGWRCIRLLFVDKTGMGELDEPALTIGEFAEELRANRGYAIVNEGPFQLHMGEFIRIGEDGLPHADYNGEDEPWETEVCRGRVDELGKRQPRKGVFLGDAFVQDAGN